MPEISDRSPLKALDPAAHRVWIVDNDPTTRTALDARLCVDSFAVHSFSNATAFFEALAHTLPDCVVADHELPDSDGLTLQSMLAERDIGLPLVFFVRRANIRIAVEAMRRGAHDFIEKPEINERLLGAIATAARSGSTRRTQHRNAARYRRAVQALTPREREILEAIERGARNKHVAALLKISPRTVESHRESAMRKLQARTAAEMVHIYFMAHRFNEIEASTTSSA